MSSIIQEGDLVVSCSGHDKGRIYFVLEAVENFAKCVDGRYRIIENPKVKNFKHLKSLDINFKNLLVKHKNKKLYDFEVKTIIKKEVKMHKV